MLLRENYTLISHSGTEKYIGETVKEAGVPRESLFVTTKLP